MVDEIKAPLASVALFLAHDDQAVTRRILVGISQAISQIVPINQKILGTLQGLLVNSEFR